MAIALWAHLGVDRLLRVEEVAVPNREDSVLDAIDQLVDWQLQGGDRSDSFHGEQYREQQVCPWCDNGWHFLPITRDLHAMRMGSYGQDEFGIGIVDPDYRYQDDESPIICPGSEWLAPPTSDREWEWVKQRRVRSRSGWQSRALRPPIVHPYLPSGRLRRLRFHGPFNLWTVSLDDEREIEEIRAGPNLMGVPGWPPPNERTPIVTRHTLTVTWELNMTIRGIRNHEWIQRNQHDIEEMIYQRDGWSAQMKDISFPFREFMVHAENANADEPDWIEFETTYKLEELHPWFAQFWQWSGTADYCELRPIVSEVSQTPQGFESDYVIIDEAHEMSNDRLWANAGQGTEAYVDQIQSTIRTLAQETAVPLTILSGVTPEEARHQTEW